MHCMSYNVDFATYPRTGVFWRGGLLHSVSGVSYWTLQAGIVGHLRPYANNGRFSRHNKRSKNTKCQSALTFVRCRGVQGHGAHPPAPWTLPLSLHLLLQLVE